MNGDGGIDAYSRRQEQWPEGNCLYTDAGHSMRGNKSAMRSDVAPLLEGVKPFFLGTHMHVRGSRAFLDSDTGNGHSSILELPWKR